MTQNRKEDEMMFEIIVLGICIIFLCGTVSYMIVTALKYPSEFKEAVNSILNDFIAPFKNKYGLKKFETLPIAKNELSIEKSPNVKCEIRRWFVERPKGNCIVSIMKNKSDNTYSFVNLTAGHICTCRFDSIDKALKDIEEKKKTGDVTNWYEL